MLIIFSMLAGSIIGWLFASHAAFPIFSWTSWLLQAVVRFYILKLKISMNAFELPHTAEHYSCPYLEMATYGRLNETFEVSNRSSFGSLRCKDCKDRMTPPKFTTMQPSSLILRLLTFFNEATLFQSRKALAWRGGALESFESLFFLIKRRLLS